MEKLAGSSIPGPYIIFVEDDHDDQELIRDMLKSLGWDSRTAVLDSAEQLLDLLDQITEPALLPTLIVLDYNLPRLGGEATLVLLKKDKRYMKMPVVLYSTTMTTEKENDLLTLGANFCRKKPSSLDGLHLLFGEFLGFARLLYDVRPAFKSR